MALDAFPVDNKNVFSLRIKLWAVTKNNILASMSFYAYFRRLSLSLEYYVSLILGCAHIRLPVYVTKINIRLIKGFTVPRLKKSQSFSFFE